MMRLLNKLRRGPSCDEIMEVLQSYLDGETDEQTAIKVASHLDDCTECDRESKVYQDIKASLATRRKPIDPKIMSALRQFGDELVAGPTD